MTGGVETIEVMKNTYEEIQRFFKYKTKHVHWQRPLNSIDGNPVKEQRL